MNDITAFRVADLPQNRPTEFELSPDADHLQRLIRELDLSGLRKVRFAGSLQARGKKDWMLTARLGATVVQPCVVSLDPVTTRIETDVSRHFLADLPEPDAEEVEMPEDETLEHLGDEIDVAEIMEEALALALPLYPRKDDADLGEAVFTEPGKTAMRDENARPFAGLAGLRDALDKKE